MTYKCSLLVLLEIYRVIIVITPCIPDFNEWYIIIITAHLPFTILSALYLLTYPLPRVTSNQPNLLARWYITVLLSPHHQTNTHTNNNIQHNNTKHHRLVFFMAIVQAGPLPSIAHQLFQIGQQFLINTTLILVHSAAICLFDVHPGRWW